jgi:hypothetical protein
MRLHTHVSSSYGLRPHYIRKHVEGASRTNTLDANDISVDLKHKSSHEEEGGLQDSHPSGELCQAPPEGHVCDHWR